MMQLSIVSIPVSDQERAKAFYQDVLGFSVMIEGELQPGLRWVQMKPPSGPTAISLVTWFEVMPPGSVQGLVLDTGDIEFVHEKLTGRGLAVSAIETAPWGRYAGFHDPDGNGWNLVTLNPR
jgi:catechol 2,3-dioxygenase-like lactoylglutathione lyase family enzyme